MPRNKIISTVTLNFKKQLVMISIIYLFFVSCMKMFGNSSVRYYQRSRDELHKKFCEIYKIPSEEKEKKNNDIFMKYIKM